MQAPLGICQADPDPWLNPVSRSQYAARELCAPCPVLADCATYAQQYQWRGVVIAGWYAGGTPDGYLLDVPWKDNPDRHPARDTLTKDELTLHVLTTLPWWYEQMVGSRLTTDGEHHTYQGDNNIAINASLTHLNRRFNVTPGRLTYLWANREPVPQGTRVVTTCGIRGCCTPDHLIAK